MSGLPGAFGGVSFTPEGKIKDVKEVAKESAQPAARKDYVLDGRWNLEDDGDDEIPVEERTSRT